MWRVEPSVQLAGIVALTCVVLGCGDEFAAEPAAPLDADACNGPGALGDDFEDGALSDLFATYANVATLTVAERAGALVFAPAEESSDGRRTARYAVDLRNSAVVVEVPETLAGVDGKTTYLSLLYDNANDLSIGRNAEELSFAARTDSGSTSSATPYNAEAHRWWRLAEASGVVGFDTAPDGATWTTQYQIPTPAFVEAATILLAVYDNGQGGPPGEAHFDNLNPQGGRFCGLGDLRVPFDAPLGLAWNLRDGGDCVGTVANGALALSVPAGLTGDCNYVTRHGFSLEGQSLTVAFPNLSLTTDGVRVALSLTAGDVDALTMQHGQGTLWVSTALGAAQSSADTTLGEGPSWWRIREAAGHVAFEISSDGTQFEAVHELIVDALPQAFTVSLRFYVNQAQAQDTRLLVDAIN